LKWKAGIGDYAITIGWAGLAFWLTPFILAFTPFGELVRNSWMVLSSITASFAAVIYVGYIRRLANERQFIFSKDGISYHHFKDDVHDMTWTAIKNVFYKRRFQAHTHELSTGASLQFKSATDTFTFRGLSDVQTNELLIVLLKLKLGDKFTSDDDVSNPRTRKPQSARTIAQVLNSWGDFKLAERILRSALPYAPVFDKHNIDGYLNDYAEILRKLGRTQEAVEVEARAPERVKELCTRKAILDER
jgi:hypothetical protein